MARENSPSFKIFPSPQHSDWVSQIDVNALFPIVSNYYNKKHEN